MAKRQIPRYRPSAAPALAASDPWRRDRLADQVYGRLLEDIVSGSYEVGDRLPAEKDLASSFAVSRPVVREALTRLAADGLVSARQGAGTFITRLPPRQIVKLAPRASIAGILRVFEVRIALEGAPPASWRRSAARWRPCARPWRPGSPPSAPISPFTAPWRWRPAI
jgi:DNA-binding GntR family transcriptional regulator